MTADVLCVVGLARACVERGPFNPADGLMTCRPCRDRLERTVAELPALMADLEVMLRREGSGLGGRTGGEEPTFISGPVVEARSHLFGVASSWAALVCEDRGFTAPANTVEGVAVFLVRNVDWLCAQPFVDEFAREIDEVSRRGRRYAYPSGVRRITLKDDTGSPVRCLERFGVCDVVSRVESSLRCEGWLAATVRPQETTALLGEITCPSCGLCVDSGNWYRFGERWRKEQVA